MKTRSMIIERLGGTSHRLTKGQRYHAVFNYSRGKYYIIDDMGDPMTPSYKDGDYWFIIKGDDAPSEINTSTEDKTNQSEENIMLIIETAVLVNNRNAKEMSVNDVIGLIKKEKSELEKLSALDLKSSKAIQGMLIKHNSNIARLVEILDNVVEGEA